MTNMKIKSETRWKYESEQKNREHSELKTQNRTIVARETPNELSSPTKTTFKHWPRKPSTGDSLPLMPIMQAVRDCRGNDFRVKPEIILTLPRYRRIFLQCQMRPRTIIIIHAIFLKPIKMTLVQNDKVVQTFPPNRTNEAFRDTILPVIGDNKNCLRNK